MADCISRSCSLIHYGGRGAVRTPLEGKAGFEPAVSCRAAGVFPETPLARICRAREGAGSVFWAQRCAAVIVPGWGGRNRTGLQAGKDWSAKPAALALGSKAPRPQLSIIRHICAGSQRTFPQIRSILPSGISAPAVRIRDRCSRQRGQYVQQPLPPPAWQSF